MDPPEPLKPSDLQVKGKPQSRTP
ncbi:hypothetical protein NC651_029633 [Populus alba x Populus x berolinensis]|nr:hypothetical protein NC651_029633 [Populus alba x Populus x berolinensis]